MTRIVLCVCAVLLTATVKAQPAATLPVDQLLKDRLGLAATDVARFTAGEAVAALVPAQAGNEIAAVGAVRATGDLRRLVLWLRDIEAFMKASGTVNVGAIKDPATAADFARLNLDDVDLSDLAACRPGSCGIRMPVQFAERFQKEVNWKGPDVRTQAPALARTLIGEYVAAYQKGGDAALGAYHDARNPGKAAKEFQDLLRRSTKAWDLAHPFVSYVETFPASAPPGVESRFYWTRDKAVSNPTLTLHHVVLQEFPDGRLLVADKQFYASRDIDAALMLALGVPTPDQKSFDLVVSVKARADGISGLAGRLLRGRIEKALTDSLKVYLEWIKASAAL